MNTVVRTGVWKFNIGEVISALVEDFVRDEVGVGVGVGDWRAMMAESDVLRLDCFLSNGPGCLLTSKANCDTKQEKQHDLKHFQISRRGNSHTYQSGATATGQGRREIPGSIGRVHFRLVSRVHKVR